MTTNGVLLKKLAQPLAEAGLQRVNVSVDTLNPEKFHRLTRWGKLEDVWEGVLAAEKAGLTPIKLNAVVVKGYNEEDVVDLARLTLDHPWQIRFIEMMPFAGVTDVQTGQVITAAQIQERIQSALGELEVSNGGKLDGEARVFQLPGAQGRSRFYLFGDQPVLRFLHACPPHCRWAFAPVPAAGERTGFACTAARRRDLGRPSPVDPRWDLGKALGTRPGRRRDPP